MYIISEGESALLCVQVVVLGSLHQNQGALLQPSESGDSFGQIIYRQVAEYSDVFLVGF